MRFNKKAGSILSHVDPVNICIRRWVYHYFSVNTDSLKESSIALGDKHKEGLKELGDRYQKGLNEASQNLSNSVESFGRHHKEGFNKFGMWIFAEIGFLGVSILFSTRMIYRYYCSCRHA